jgi:hypothetical protein
VPRDGVLDARHLAQIDPGTHDHVVRVAERAGFRLLPFPDLGMGVAVRIHFELENARNGIEARKLGGRGVHPSALLHDPHT